MARYLFPFSFCTIEELVRPVNNITNPLMIARLIYNVVREESHDQGGVTYYYRNIYLVPDPYIRTKGYLKAKSIRVKNIPLIGRVVDIRWKGKLRG